MYSGGMKTALIPKLKITRKFYNLPYTQAMKIAADFARSGGVVDFKLYKEIMDRYEAVRLRRLSR